MYYLLNVDVIRVGQSYEWATSKHLHDKSINYLTTTP